MFDYFVMYVIVGILFELFYPGVWETLSRPMGGTRLREAVSIIFAFTFGVLLWPTVLISDLVWRARGKPN